MERAKTLIEQGDIAAEGIQGAGGYIVGTKKILGADPGECEGGKSLDSWFCARDSDLTQVDAIFILDEVMTSRVGPSGLQAVLGLNPDPQHSVNISAVVSRLVPSAEEAISWLSTTHARETLSLTPARSTTTYS